MSIIKAVVGQSLTPSTYFRNPDGTPITPAPGMPAQYALRDFNFNLIVSGNGQQDSGDPSRWFATVTLPPNAPVSTDGLQKYSFTWQLQGVQGTVTTTEMFEVYPDGDPVRRINDTDVILFQGQIFTDNVYVETQGLPSVSSVSFQILDEFGNIAYTAPGNPLAVVGHAGTADIYSVSDVATTLIAGTILMTYLGVWTIVRPGMSTTFEYHPFYVVNASLIKYMNAIQQLVDRARIGDIHPYLSFKPVDYIHHLFRGIEYVAASRPNIIPISPAAMPGMLADAITKASARSLLQAQYLAEGMSSFNFSGLGVQLDVDRTQFLQNMIQELTDDLNNNLPATKANWIRNGMPTGPVGASTASPNYNKGGILTISIGAYTNFESRGFGLWGAGFVGSRRSFFGGVPVYNIGGG